MKTLKEMYEEGYQQAQQEGLEFLDDLEVEAKKYNIKKHKHFVSKIQERIAELKGAKGK